MRCPIRLLLKQYHLLDAISTLPVTVINASIDVFDSIPPFRPLVDSLQSLEQSTPRPWLVLRKTIKDLHTNVLHDFRHILESAIAYTNQILRHDFARPKMRDEALLNKSHLNRILVRKYVLLTLQSATTGWIDSLSSPSQTIPIRLSAPLPQTSKASTGTPKSVCQTWSHSFNSVMGERYHGTLSELKCAEPRRSFSYQYLGLMG